MDHEKLEKAFKDNKRRIDSREDRVDAKAVTVVVPDVRAIRDSLGLSQSEFASAFWLSLNSVRNWEQGVRKPEGPARAYLTAIQYNPEAIAEALSHSIADRLQVSLQRNEDPTKIAQLGVSSATIADFGGKVARDLSGIIESANDVGESHSLAASTRKGGASKSRRSIANLVDVSGLTFAKVFVSEDTSIGIRMNVSGDYYRLALDGQEFELRIDELGNRIADGLSLARFLSLIKNGVSVAKLFVRRD